jgi:hypothetical protein
MVSGGTVDGGRIEAGSAPRLFPGALAAKMVSRVSESGFQINAVDGVPCASERLSVRSPYLLAEIGHGPDPGVQGAALLDGLAGFRGSTASTIHAHATANINQFNR